MKLRLRGDSIRLRLTQTEVRALADAGVVEETVRFGEGPLVSFSYAIRAAAPTGAPASARLVGARIEVLVAPDAARSWADSDAVGIEATQPIGDGHALRILVEKDFACLKERADEDDGDAFPNPSTTC